MLSMRRGFRLRAGWPLTWRHAATHEWPPLPITADDFAWSREAGIGLVAEHGDEMLFLIDRDWFGWPDPPQWGLASYDRNRNRWALWGDFDEWPKAWQRPAPMG